MVKRGFVYYTSVFPCCRRIRIIKFIDRELNLDRWLNMLNSKVIYEVLNPEHKYTNRRRCPADINYEILHYAHFSVVLLFSLPLVQTL
jgi:hypothetical protein